jgi:hypothetical protein
VEVGSKTSTEDVATGTEVVIVVEIGAASTAEAEALLAAGVGVGVGVATVAEVEMEVVTGAAEFDAVTGVEMEVVLGAAEFEAGPMERHSCCMEWAHGLQDKFERHMDNLVYWRKHVFEAWFWRLVGCEGRLMLTR